MIEDTPNYEEQQNPHFEEPWSDRLEKRLQKWMSICKERMTAHEKEMNRMYYLNNVTGLSPILVNLATSSTLSILSNVQQCNNLELILVGAIGSGIAMMLGSIHQWFTFSKREEQHKNFSDLYSALLLRMEHMLDRNTTFRPPSDQTILEFRMTLERLLSEEPIVYNICRLID